MSSQNTRQILSKCDFETKIWRASEREWSEIIELFGDATIYQTRAYGKVRWGENNLAHIIVKANGEITAAAQLRVVRLPFLRIGVAYVFRGPLWRPLKDNADGESLTRIMRAINQEYLQRGFLIRVVPNEIDSDSGPMRSVLEEEGFRWLSSPYRTLLVDLTIPLQDLRSSLSKSWRKHLTRSEGNGLKIVEGTEDSLFETVISLYNQLVSRKGFKSGIDVEEFKLIQRCLLDPLKMQIMICEFNNIPIAALVGSSIGNTGIELVAASNPLGLELGGSYLLRWRMLEWLKRKGCKMYDLCGIDPIKNPGGYQFKKGFSGKLGKDIQLMGQFDSCQSRLIQSCMHLWTFVKSIR